MFCCSSVLVHNSPITMARSRQWCSSILSLHITTCTQHIYSPNVLSTCTHQMYSALTKCSQHMYSPNALSTCTHQMYSAHVLTKCTQHMYSPRWSIQYELLHLALYLISQPRLSGHDLPPPPPESSLSCTDLP